MIRLRLDRILRDRITEVQVKPLSRNDKLHISKGYLLPEILNSVGYNFGDFSIDQNELDFIIENYTYEAGVRKLKEKIFEIIRELNLQKILGKEIDFPYTISKKYIEEIFSDKSKVHIQKIAKKPHVGVVNGLYATTTGTGGLTLIEVLRIPSDKKLELELTGSQGDIMKESMRCAKTLAWHLLSHNIKNIINKEWDKNGTFGLHIHCPSAAMTKDGPSAGITITTAILSQLCNVAVKNNIAMTGEVDLHGNVHPIGGLDSKLFGAVRAGVDTVLIPKDNEDDYKKYLKKLNETEQLGILNENIDLEKEKNIKVIIVKNIKEVIRYAFVKNILNF